jgi:histidinol phosphatase-like enzyme (inositol monophosphatase family)
MLVTSVLERSGLALFYSYRMLLHVKSSLMVDHTSRLHALNGTTVKVAAFVLSNYQNNNFSITTKNDGSDVTNVDIEAQQMAKELLLSQFTDDGFLGEEDDEQIGVSGYRWVVDPIDGTTSFVRGVPLFGTQIGLEYGGKPIAGKIVMPAIGESIFAQIGEGAWHNVSDQPAKISSTILIEEAMVCTTSIDYYKQTNSMHMFEALAQTGCSVRGWSDCYAFMLLCTGRIDAVIEPLLHPWDIVPWLPIISESGGVFSQIGSGGIASNPTIHAALYDALHEQITN